MLLFDRLIGDTFCIRLVSPRIGKARPQGDPHLTGTGDLVSYAHRR